MIACPSCGSNLTRLIRSQIKLAKSKAASKAGSAGTGASKRRNVDYAALAILSHAARREKAS